MPEWPPALTTGTPAATTNGGSCGKAGALARSGGLLRDELTGRRNTLWRDDGARFLHLHMHIRAPTINLSPSRIRDQIIAVTRLVQGADKTQVNKYRNVSWWCVLRSARVRQGAQ